jgi:Bacterial membrane protein YfhO
LKTKTFDQAQTANRIPFPKHVVAILGFFIGFYVLWFLPSLLGGELLGPGDGYIQSIPAYYADRTLWTTQLLGGFPVAADVTPQTWYPLSWLLSRLPHSWNGFVLSSYVLASAFTYAYVYVITRSVLAGLVAGLTYGASGFMMAHLGHTSMIHTATWIPLTLLACEQFRRSHRLIWVVLLATAIACLFLAGHPQISVYGLGLVGAYAAVFGRDRTQHRTQQQWAFYGWFALAIGTGIGLAAIQLVPTAELAGMTPRAAMTFPDFLAFSMPPSHAIMAIFPYIFGGGNVPPYQLPYTGESSPTEITIYMGLLPLTLAIVGGRARNYRQSFRRFWIMVALISFLLLLGRTTPLPWLSYHLPAYNKFRVLPRHGIELAMAISVLAGLGISAIQQQQLDGPRLKKLLRSSSALMGVMLIWAIVAGATFLHKRHLANSPDQFIAFLAPTILGPLGIFILGLVSLSVYVRQSTAPRRSSLAAIALLAVLTIDLSAFGWFYQWQDSPTAATTFSPPVFLQKYQTTLQQKSQRFFPLNGGLGTNSEVPPNLSRLWNAPSMSGYGPLLISRVGDFMGLTPPGGLISTAPLFDSRNRSFDLTAVRYLTTPSTGATAAVGDRRWQYVEDLGDVRIYENLHVMPRAWLTSQIQTAQPAQILTAIKTSQLPDGSNFAPESIALIEESLNFPPQSPDPNSSVVVAFPSETQVRVQTSSAKPAFLVLSDVFYPGWEAHVDGQPAHIFQTDYILRGINLTPGQHTVVFSFRPRSFQIGCTISGAAFVLLLYLIVADRQRGQSNSAPIDPNRHHEFV